MIQLTAIEVRGTSDAGPFRGALTLSPGLQVISARNAYGKSLAVTAVAWCLGLEPMLGFPDNDSSCFSEAARERLEFEGRPSARVIASECSISLVHQDGRQLRLTRDIKGEPTTVHVEEQSANSQIRRSKLNARRATMQDEHGGLQRFLFEWLRWPREDVTTFKGPLAEVYLENLTPAFYIDQDEGWTDLQALQITRYGQQQIAEIAVEYLLGAIDAIKARVARQQAAAREAALREGARTIADRVGALFLRNGWAIEWSGHGSINDTLARWSSRTLKETLKRDAEVDLAEQRVSLDRHAEALRQALTSGPVDPANVSAPAGASQRVIDLKMRRHELSSDLRTLRTQYAQAAELLDSLGYRIHAAVDLLRLKTTGVGRLDHMECPTCHRDLDPMTFSLTVQSRDSIAAHIESLKRDRELMTKNVEAIAAARTAVEAELSRIDGDFRDAERALITVTGAIGTIREQVAKTAADLAAVERRSDRLAQLVEEINELQTEIDHWTAEARAVTRAISVTPDFDRRRAAFLNALREYLLALGHSAVTRNNVDALGFDDQYAPYLDGRRLRSLGSASDRARLVAAYSLALAAASREVAGFHPGVVILDEPLQQNPDVTHRDLFIAFLAQQLAREAKFQTVIFTWLQDHEIDRLREKGTNVITPEGEHFLKLMAPTSVAAAPTGAE